jgi:hypothetical protein
MKSFIYSLRDISLTFIFIGLLTGLICIFNKYSIFLFDGLEIYLLIILMLDNNFKLLFNSLSYLFASKIRFIFFSFANYPSILGNDSFLTLFIKSLFFFSSLFPK